MKIENNTVPGGLTPGALNDESEERGGYTVTSEMKRVWQVEMDLLSRLIDVCQRNNLRMWVDGGTLLGAVRHKGFIPWDDDIDVCMPRDDYDRLISIGADAFREPYFLQSAYSDKGYCRGHAQLRNSNTAAIRPSDSYRPFNQGIFIDIFVLDGMPSDPQKLRDILKEWRRTTRFLKAHDTALLASGRIGLVFRKMQCRREVKRRGWQPIFREAEDLLRSTSWEEATKVAELGFSGDSIVFDRHIFDTTLWLPFENMSVPVPGGYDLFLRTQYGDDYMTPRQAPSYHGTVVFDTTRSYVELLPEVKKQYRSERWHRLWSKFNRHK